MEEWVRDIILKCLEPLFSLYFKNIQKCLELNRIEYLDIYAKQVEGIFNFIDSVNPPVIKF